MIDHVSIPVANLESSTALYSDVLAPLELTQLVRRDASVGFGKRYPEFWLNLRVGLPRASADTGTHICLRAPSDEAVRSFFERAISAGCASAGGPGPRQAAMTAYFGAFIFDFDGNKIEAVCFPMRSTGG